MNKQTLLFFATARERYRIFLRKQIGHKPYFRLTMANSQESSGVCPLDRAFTEDPIFQKYRFCNVFREADRVTTWFRDNVRTPLAIQYPGNHLLQVRAAVAFRWFNLPATGNLLIPWLFGVESMKEVKTQIMNRQRRGEPILNAAYMIKSPPGLSKTEGLFWCLQNIEDNLEPLTTDMVCANTLQRAHELLVEYPYLGPFMAYQSVCDLRFTSVLEKATDVYTWTCPGPGSARGISRIVFGGNPTKLRYTATKDKNLLLANMESLLAFSRNNDLWPNKWPRWELSTVQHWACEFDKYMRKENGEGEPKQLYKPNS